MDRNELFKKIFILKNEFVKCFYRPVRLNIKEFCLISRAEAVAVYSEIAKLTESKALKTFNLKYSDKNDPLAELYQLRIRMF